MALSMAQQLKSVDCNLTTLHADNDSSTTAKVKSVLPELKKKDDHNHIKKGISKMLYGLSKR